MPLRLPKLFTVRGDPFERADEEGIGYDTWRLERAFALVPAQAFVANWLQSFKQFPAAPEAGELQHRPGHGPADLRWHRQLSNRGKRPMRHEPNKSMATVSKGAAAALVAAAVARDYGRRAIERSPAVLWNDGPAKQAILELVEAVTEGGADYVAPEDRIATFDQDGTLWVEHPIYTQVVFALDRS